MMLVSVFLCNILCHYFFLCIQNKYLHESFDNKYYFLNFWSILIHADKCS